MPEAIKIEHSPKGPKHTLTHSYLRQMKYHPRVKKNVEPFHKYYLGNMFSSTFKERYLNFSLKQVSKIYEHFSLLKKIYNLSAIKPFRNAISLKLIMYFQKW